MEKRFLVFGVEILILILFFKLVSANIIINEVMVNPSDEYGGDSKGEWVEIYNEGGSPINLSGWKISDLSSSDDFEFGFQGNIIQPSGYAVITDDDTYVYFLLNVSSSAIKIHVSGAIGSGLNNGAENITIFDKDNNVIDSFNYSSTTEDWSWSLINNVWQQVQNITPGYNNSYTQSCDPGVEISLSKYIYDNNEVVYFTPKVEGNYNYQIEYWIEDLFGRIAKSKVITENSNQKQWTADVNGEDSVYIIKANLTYSDCDDISEVNNYDEKIIGVRGSEAINSSFLNIEEIYLGNDKKAKFGDTLRVKINIYKGDTDKQSVQLWLEDDDETEISKRTRAHAYEDYRSYNLTLPVQIEPNCNHGYPDGHYNLVLEGLDKRVEDRVKIEGITSLLCEEVIVEKSSGDGNFFYEVLELPAEIKVGEEFTTKLEIQNNLSEERFVKVWSYVYKGSTSLSGNREENLQAVRISAEDSKILELKNSVKDAEAGDYKFKIKIERDDRKTLKEITKDIMVVNDAESAEFIEERKAQAGIAEIINAEKISSAIVYESSDVKASRNALYFFSFILVLLICYFLFGRRL